MTIKMRNIINYLFKKDLSVLQIFIPHVKLNKNQFIKYIKTERGYDSYLLDENTISISSLTKEINDNERKILSLFSKKRIISNSEIMDLFLEKNKSNSFFLGRGDVNLVKFDASCCPDCPIPHT